LTLRAGELDDVAKEIGRTLVGRVLQKVIAPDDDVYLGFSRGWLLLSTNARAGRMHLVDKKPPGTGEAASSYCMLLRKELVGARLEAVRVVAGERAAELVFSDGRALRLFLYGASAQLQLVADGRVLGVSGPGRRHPAELPPPRPQAPRESRFPSENPSAAIAAHYADVAGEAARAHAETQRRAARKKLERLVAALGRDRDRALAAIDKRKHADLLLAHLAEIPKGASSVTLPDDFTDGAPLAIALDPSLSARDNAARLYKEHKRLSRALAGIERRLADAQAKLAKLDRGDFVAEARAPRSPAANKRARDQRPPPYREFRSSTGVAILVGRGADRNDELTFKVARGADLWLHTRDYAGAHVIVPLSGKPVDGETLIDAATLAAHHSNARGEAQVDVVYVARKLVRKPPKSAPGTVTHSGGKTVRVRLEPERLARLLASRVDEDR
jgi:predicted ribosome quality control (RQC) complex YloA/Tae2 family protein